MCEVISESKILRHKETGKNPSAEEIYNYSPTGELYKIFEWYDLAVAVLAEARP